MHRHQNFACRRRTTRSTYSQRDMLLHRIVHRLSRDIGIVRRTRARREDILWILDSGRNQDKRSFYSLPRLPLLGSHSYHYSGHIQAGSSGCLHIWNAFLDSPRWNLFELHLSCQTMADGRDSHCCPRPRVEVDGVSWTHQTGFPHANIELRHFRHSSCPDHHKLASLEYTENR